MFAYLRQGDMEQAVAHADDPFDSRGRDSGRIAASAAVAVINWTVTGKMRRHLGFPTDCLVAGLA